MHHAHSARLRGFTLIELLIVVAIIAILASIAVPNFLEAQTRAKISRAKSDMRSISVGVESYFTDYGAWPYPTLKEGTPPPSSLQYATELSTPIAYLPTVMLKDPFHPTWAGMKYYPVPPRSDFAGTYRYANGNGYYGQHGTTNPLYSPFPCYVLSSVGPDGCGDGVEWMAAVLWIAPHNPHAVVDGILTLATIYDPTNGTNSCGDIPRFCGESAAVAFN